MSSVCSARLCATASSVSFWRTPPPPGPWVEDTGARLSQARENRCVPVKRARLNTNGGAGPYSGAVYAHPPPLDMRQNRYPGGARSDAWLGSGVTLRFGERPGERARHGRGAAPPPEPRNGARTAKWHERSTGARARLWIVRADAVAHAVAPRTTQCMVSKQTPVEKHWGNEQA